MTKHPITHYPAPILNEHQPSKPRLYMNHTDRLPTPHRPDSDYINELPRVFMGWRIWPDGRREPAHTQHKDQE